MKNKNIVILLTSLLMLTGCVQTQPTSGGSQEDNPPSNPGSDPVDPVNPEQEDDYVDDYRVKSISIGDSSIKLELNKYKYLFINYNATVDVDSLTDEEKEITWTSLDTSIASVNQYGKVTGLKDGYTYITATTKRGNRHARCLVMVGNANVSYQYTLVDDLSTLHNKDTVVIACPEENKVATEYSQGSYLHATSSTFSKDKKTIESLGAGAAEFYLGESEKGWTLELGEQGVEVYFAGFNTTRVGFVNNKGNIDWRFSFYNGNLYTETYNDVVGWIMFNRDLDSHNGGFTLYDFDEEVEAKPVSLVYPSIYKLVEVVEQ